MGFFSKTNVASGNDVVAVQAGSVGKSAKSAEQARKAAEAAKRAKVTNVRSGNARVGRQADNISGGLRIR